MKNIMNEPSGLEEFDEISEGVFYATNELTTINQSQIDSLTTYSNNTKTLRARICAHPNESDVLHEMFVVIARGSYVRPHKHVNRSESLSVIGGEAYAVFFNEEGEIAKMVLMSTSNPSGIRYYRINHSTYHMLIILTKNFAFHEATSGPFNRNDTVFADWCPEGCDSSENKRYLHRIEKLSKTLVTD